MKIAFLGNAAWSVPTLAALDDSEHDVVFVGTFPPHPGRRGGEDVASPIAQEAVRRSLPLVEAETVTKGASSSALAESEADALVVVAYGELLPKAVLAAPRFGALNVHFSLLPRYRGAAPVQRAIMDGETVTGVSIMQMDEGLDTGPILAAVETPIESRDDAGSLGARLAGMGATALLDVLSQLEAGTVVAKPQDDAQATYAAKVTRVDRGVRWSASARSIRDTVRAFAPQPGAVAMCRGATLKVIDAKVVRGEGDAGKVIDPGRCIIATGDGALQLLRVVPEGRRELDGAAFARSIGLKMGEQLGVG